MSRSEAIEAFEKDGWIDIGSGIDNESSYDKFLELVANLGDMDYISDMHVQNLFVFPASSKKFWALNPLVKEAKIILQDKVNILHKHKFIFNVIQSNNFFLFQASCLPAMLLAPPKKSIVLDMCAAPGGKTTQLAAIMKNKGCIYAVEQNTGRFEILAKRKKLTNSSIVKLFNQDVLTITDEQIPNVQYIMIDPSCSGSGMVDQLLRFDENKKPDGLYNLAGLQIKILSYAMGTFKHAQKIVYSTCSIYPEENEEVVQRCLEMCPHWELIKPLEFAEKWKNFGSPKYKHIGKKCIYAKPEIDFTNGFFVAVFQRREDVEFDYDANRKKYWSRERAAEKYHAVDDDYEDDGGAAMENYNDMETIDNGKANDIIENESEIISKNGQSNEVDELTEKVKAKKKKKKKNKETALKVDPGDSITISTEVKETSNNSDDIEKIDLVECKVNKKKRIRNDSELLSKNESNEIDESIEKVKTKKKKKEKLIEEDIIDKEKEKTDQVEDLIVKKMKKKKKHSHDNE